MTSVTVWLPEFPNSRVTESVRDGEPDYDAVNRAVADLLRDPGAHLASWGRRRGRRRGPGRFSGVAATDYDPITQELVYLGPIEIEVRDDG
jgi:hypothetical protein